MPTTRLNASTVTGLKPRDASYITYDAVARGFGVRTTPAGAKSYVLTYRLRDGRQRRMTIGRADQMLVIDARREAQALLLRIGQGDDPLGEVEIERGAPTMALLWDRYVAEHMTVNKRPRSQVEDRTMWCKYIEPAMGGRKVEEVTVEDVTALFNRVKRAGLQAEACRRGATPVHHAHPCHRLEDARRQSMQAGPSPAWGASQPVSDRCRAEAFAGGGEPSR